PDPVLQLLRDARGHLVYREGADRAQEILQPLLAELFVDRIQGLGDAVGEDNQDVAGVERERAFLVASLREHTDNRAAGGKFFHRRITAGAQEIGRIVARIYIA